CTIMGKAAPAEVDEGDRFAVRVTTVSPHGCRLTLRVREAGAATAIGQTSVDLAPGQQATELQFEALNALKRDPRRVHIDLTMRCPGCICRDSLELALRPRKRKGRCDLTSVSFDPVPVGEGWPCTLVVTGCAIPGSTLTIGAPRERDNRKGRVRGRDTHYVSGEGWTVTSNWFASGKGTVTLEARLA